ncbi:MAG: cupredoxin domain-containing protein [Microthrixaceae bacterium]
MHRRLASAALLVALLAGCVDSKPSSPTAEDLHKIDVSPDHTITVDERGFTPRALRVRSGDVVLLVNRGTGLHSFTADERFDTGRLHPGDEATLVLTEPGEIDYRDLEAPEHRATVTVVR